MIEIEKFDSVTRYFKNGIIDLTISVNIEDIHFDFDISENRLILEHIDDNAKLLSDYMLEIKKEYRDEDYEVRHDINGNIITIILIPRKLLVIKNEKYLKFGLIGEYKKKIRN